MNRGKYRWPDNEERQAWVRIVGSAIEYLLNDPEAEEWDATNFDISPYLLDSCVEAHGWACEGSGFEREDLWLYYSHADYPDRRMCIYSDGYTYRLTLSINYKVED